MTAILRHVITLVEFVVVQPPLDEIVEQVLASVLHRRPFIAELEMTGVDRPWVQRFSIRMRVEQVTAVGDGWLDIVGIHDGDPLRSSIQMYVWHGDGPPRKRLPRRVARRSATPPETPTGPTPMPATAWLILR